MKHDTVNNLLFGLSFVSGNPGDILVRARAISQDGPRQIVTANVDHVVTLADQPRFREAYSAAVARTLDGMPLVWLSRLRGAAGAVRITGHDLLAAAIAGPQDANERLFMVSPTGETARAVAALFTARGLTDGQIAYDVPPHGFEHDAAYGAALRDRIRQHGTTLLLMGVGAPKSEIWVHQQGAALGSPVVLNIGEALNVAAGRLPRAPLWLQRLGLEWLFRFASQPKRLFHRYFVRSWRFLAIAITDRRLATEACRPATEPRTVA